MPRVRHTAAGPVDPAQPLQLGPRQQLRPGHAADRGPPRTPGTHCPDRRGDHRPWPVRLRPAAPTHALEQPRARQRPGPPERAEPAQHPSTRRDVAPELPASHRPAPRPSRTRTATPWRTGAGRFPGPAPSLRPRRPGDNPAPVPHQPLLPRRPAGPPSGNRREHHTGARRSVRAPASARRTLPRTCRGFPAPADGRPQTPGPIRPANLD
ncbi:hypothetical protein KPATCC21470_7218 [Kitasatospora purpeofusca]